MSGSFSYLATDALGSSTVVLNPTGTPTAATLYAPYGSVRYSTGTMPTDYGFTGQHSDAAATGLDYYNARYYDPLAQQFTSADTVLPGDGMDVWGLSRYAYVEGNPLIRVDPSGHDGGWLGGLVSAVTSTVSSAASMVVSVAHTPCTTCAGSTTQAKQTLSGTLNNLSTLSTFDNTSLDFGYGLWPASSTDANGQKTTYKYDRLGRMTETRAPGQGTGVATQATVYDNTACSLTGADTPCVEVDTSRRTSSSFAVTTRQFYDGEGRLVETRTPAPNGLDAIRYTLYNAAGQASQASVSYFVTAYTGGPGAAAFSIPDSTQAVTTTSYDGLGRVIAAHDPLSNTGTMDYSVVCNAPGTGDAACYEQTLAVDPNGHQQGSLSDGFGRTIYTQQYTGSTPATYAVYATTKNSYDALGRVTQTLAPDGHSLSTASYDDAGRLTSAANPDRGLSSYLYDSNGNLTEQIDARCGTSLPQTGCSAGTIYTGYDGLNRPIWRNSNNWASGAYVTYSYDGSPTSYGAGRLTAEVFRGNSGTGATSFSGAYTYTYDALGRTIRTDQTMGGAGACPTAASGWTCADIGAPNSTGGQSAAGDSIWTVSGGGADISGTSDQFHFVSQTQSGDMTLSAHVDMQTFSSDWAKAGLMVRASTAANAAFYDAYVTPQHGIRVEYRDTTGAAVGLQASTGGLTPVYLAIARNGTTYYTFTSPDGTTWTLLQGSKRTISTLGGAAQVGLAVTGHNNGSLSTATFDNVSVLTNGHSVCPTTSSGTSWSCADIGSPGAAGSQNDLGNGVWMVSGAGTDISGTSDQFHFAATPEAGDATLSAHLAYQGNTDPWAKAGVMVRGSSAANAPFYDLVVTPGNNIRVEYRDTVGGTTGLQATVAGSAPAYVKVGRVGTTYTAYTSNDGVTWTAVTGSARTMSNLSGTVQAGLAVTSHLTGTTSTTVFDQVSMTPSSSGPAEPGSVTNTILPVPSGITSYPIATAYDDASKVKSLTYSDNELLSNGYDTGSGWLLSLSATPAGGSATTLFGGIGYSGAGGAAGHATSASVDASTYSYSASYDADVRLSSLSISHSGATLFSSARGYDAVGNVTAVNTTLSAGTDNQAYCYDEQNRLVWAGSTGTPSCGSTRTPGTLTSANYTQTFAYDTLNRLTSGPLGAYSYGDSAHLDAATAIGTSSYTATYDALGDMTCRAPSNTTTCTGTPTGATLSYDNEGRLSAWQDKPSSPTTTDSFLYDGSGNRVEQTVTVNGSITTTTTYIAGGLEESTTTGASTTLTKYFPGPNGLPTTERVGTAGPLSVLASDGQGTVSTSLDSAGNVTSAQLFTPYGVSRYSSGSSPTAHGYTGQLADGSTGLDYYNARYYDPVAGQFTSADTVDDGFNRYAYVKGNPTTATDPSGHRLCFDEDVSSCIPTGGGSSSAPTIIDWFDNSVTQDPVRNADGTVTTTTITTTTYEWSDGHRTFKYSTSSHTECDSTCHTIHNENSRRKRTDTLRNEGYTWVRIGATVGLIADLFEALSGDFLGAIKLLIVVLAATVDTITNWVANSSGSVASTLDGIAAVLSTFLGVLNAVIAAASFGFLLAGVIRLGFAAVTGGLLPLAAFVGAASIGAASSFITILGDAKMIQANDEDQMNINEWCAKYGAGACESA